MKLSFKDALVSHSPEGESKNPTKPQNGLLYNIPSFSCAKIE